MPAEKLESRLIKKLAKQPGITMTVKTQTAWDGIREWWRHWKH